MAEQRRGLGRGLSALLEEAQSAVTPERRREAGVVELPLELVRPNPEQPRRAFSQPELDELAESIRERGVIQPILVRPLPETPSEHQIIAGERRWRAAQLAGLRTIPALVRDLTPAEVMEVALIENIQRADLNALEEARGYQLMSERFSRSADEIARVVGKSRSHVANTIRLTRLPPGVQAHVETGRLTAGHARALLDLQDAEAMADAIVARGLNVRQVEALARQARERAGRPSRPAAPAKDDDTRALESDLSEALGLSVSIRHSGESGQVLIEYRTLEQLDEIARRLIAGSRRDS
ncbi:MAG TPA: ParB/RepB/Spo0J family partition protein [Caulobacteraceae bacterium]|jgi:ParB family chromosome partitioning protein|nr:ParB/RepB/Spo0J family partition protein [Caulobacteraceae bacterium]